MNQFEGSLSYRLANIAEPFRRRHIRGARQIATSLQPEWKELWLQREQLLAVQEQREPRVNNWKRLNIASSRKDSRTYRSLVANPATEDAVRLVGVPVIGRRTAAPHDVYYEVDLLQVPFTYYPDDIQSVNIDTAKVALKVARQAEQEGKDLQHLKEDTEWLSRRSFEGYVNWLRNMAAQSAVLAHHMSAIGAAVSTALLWAKNNDQMFAIYVGERRKEGHSQLARILQASSGEMEGILNEYIQKAQEDYEVQDQFSKQMDSGFYRKALEYVQQHPIKRKKVT